MNADDARREAQRILNGRLSAWGIEDADRKSRDYISDLVLAGWRWMPPDNRPQPPRLEQSCRVCFKHLNFCICGERAERAPERSEHVKEHVGNLRDIVRAAKDTPEEGA